jgi:hypothetical protein
MEGMCRNIKTLFNFDPPVTDDEVRAASLQFVRKISGFNKPSKANEDFFLGAVEEIAGISTRLLRSLETTAPPRDSGPRSLQCAQSGDRAAQMTIVSIVIFCTVCGNNSFASAVSGDASKIEAYAFRLRL